MASGAKKIDGGFGLEITDGAAQEKNEERLAGRAARSHFAQAVQVAGFQRHDGAERAEFLRAPRQRSGRDIDGIIHHGLALGERLEKRPRLGAGAAAQLRHHYIRRKLSDDLAGVSFEKARIGARQAVFRQVRDGFEKRGADVVVEVAARQRLLPAAA